jgi:hypothetical protein
MSLPEPKKQTKKNAFVATIEFAKDKFKIIKSNDDYSEDDDKEKYYDHEMTISEQAMNELHKNGETYIKQTDGGETMVIKVKYQS